MSDNRLPDAKPPPPPTTATPLDDRAASSPAHLSSPTTSPRRPVSPSESPKSPPPKRMRRSRQPEEREAQSSPSPSVSSSPEDEPAEGSRGTRGQSASAPSAGPPKKKRTRTLTTPHQSAVLHAMLAQSRFPTTAMREQVGKQIGLSARKVQVWFQNQRQKARRPKAESETPLTRPPQYGPFPNTQAQTHQEMAGSSHVLSAPVSRSGSSSAIAGPSSLRSPAEPRPFSRGADDFRVSGQSAQSSPLAGPGVPGPGAGFDTYVRGVTPSPMGAMHLPRFPAHIVAPSSSSPSQDFHAMHGISPIYPGNSPPRSILGPSISSRTRSPIILPPLQFDARRGRDPFEFAQPPRSLSSPSSGASISPTT
ncbi:homeobox-domain-containing protein [Rickenella mellea]|uniref:Homeobox-domain-containing protein n=1 Tax=Rickenella mellea TaxID=50990 RepID=A0A4Y7PUK5_9AGAM|nr:homeobox-domain-containing protein [Rickenella mellea]